MPKDLYELLDLIALAGCTAVLSWIIFAAVYW